MYKNTQALMRTLKFLLFFATKNYLYWRDWAEKRVYCRVYMCILTCTVLNGSCPHEQSFFKRSNRVTKWNVYVQEIWQRRWRHHINVHTYERRATHQRETLCACSWEKQLSGVAKVQDDFFLIFLWRKLKKFMY